MDETVHLQSFPVMKDSKIFLAIVGCNEILARLAATLDQGPMCGFQFPVKEQKRPMRHEACAINLEVSVNMLPR